MERKVRCIRSTRASLNLVSWLKRRLIIPLELPPFLSRENDAEGNARELSRDMAGRIIKDAFARAGIVRVTDA